MSSSYFPQIGVDIEGEVMMHQVDQPFADGSVVAIGALQ